MSTLLAGLGREATARVRRAMRPLGLGAQQFLLIKQLQVLGQASQAELADALAIDPSNLATIAADLADRDLVERTRDEVDRRRYVLRLSRAGEQLLAAPKARWPPPSPTSSPRSTKNSASSSTPSYADSPTASSSAPRPTMTPAQSDARGPRSHYHAGPGRAPRRDRVVHEPLRARGP